MRIGCVAVYGFGALLLAAAAQSPQAPRFTVLSSHSVATIPARVMHDVDSYGSWEPSTVDIDGLESGFANVSELRVPGGRRTFA